MAIVTKSQPETYSSLVDAVRKLAADLYEPQSRSLKTMQALLLLCAWPFPFQRTHNDPSPMYCSLATNIGYQLGLHRPLCKGDFEENTREYATATTVEMKTWYGCFIVNTWYVSHLVQTRRATERLPAGTIGAHQPAEDHMVHLHLLTFRCQPSPQTWYTTDHDARKCNTVSRSWR